MSETVSFFPVVGLLRKQARRAHTAAVWSEYYRWLAHSLEQHPGCPMTETAARLAGARATAWIHLRDGNPRAANVCRGIANQHRKTVSARA